MVDLAWVCSCLELVNDSVCSQLLLLSALFTTFQIPKLLVTIVFLLCKSSLNLFSIKKIIILVIAVTVVVLTTRLKCKSDNKDERKKVPLAIIHVSFKTCLKIPRWASTSFPCGFVTTASG